MEKRSKRINDADFIGKTFHYLTVLSTEDVNGVGKARKALCKCICGNYRKIPFNELKNGHYKSCGCMKAKRIAERSTKHGMAKVGQKHPLVPIYAAMVQRCTNPNDKRYADYGGRCIYVCREWLSDNKLFFKWAFENGWERGLEIDRIDNNLGYSPDNCRCVKSKINNRNKRTTILITYKGENKPLAEWCEILNLNYSAILTRLKRHNPTPEVLFEAPNRYQKHKTKIALAASKNMKKTDL